MLIALEVLKECKIQKDFTNEVLEIKKNEAREQLEKYKIDKKIVDDGKKPLKEMIVITIGKSEMVYEELN